MNDISSGRAHFRPDVQGLRAIAVLSVLIFHAFPTALPGGFVGVDIFFVISGYVITGAITRDIENGAFSLRTFYTKRARRLFPSLFVVLLACIAAGYLVMGPDSYRLFARSVFSTSLFVSNIDFWRTTGYFDAAAATRPLLHTWSLSVEEQYYLAFPLLFAFLQKHQRARLTPIILLILFASLVLSVWLTRQSQLAAFYLAPSRAFELLLGALLALRSQPVSKGIIREVMSATGLALILFALFFYSPATTFPGWMALPPCCGAALIIASGLHAQSETIGQRMLSISPLTFVGDISYSLYLWHWPILVFSLYAFGFNLDPSQKFLCLVAAFVCATVSYYVIERPTQGFSLKFPFLPISGAAIAVLVAISGAIFFSHGMPDRFGPEPRQMFAFSADFNKSRDRCHNEGQTIRPYASNCSFGASNTAPDVVVWGDSHGAELAMVLGSKAKLLGRSVMQITSSACPPSLNFKLDERPLCEKQNSISLEGIKADARIKTVILTMNAARYLNFETLSSGLEKTAKELRDAGKDVIVISQIPIYQYDPPEMIGLALARGNTIATIGISRESFEHDFGEWNSFLQGLAKKYAITVWSPASKLCDESLCRVYDGSAKVLYFNRDHLGLSGVEFTFGAMAQLIYPMSKPSL